MGYRPTIGVIRIAGEECRDMNEREELLGIIHCISEIIWMELPLEYQDRWLEDIRVKGIWSPDVEMVAGEKVEDL